MDSHDIEMQISQYADGSLPVQARANLETCLSGESQLRDVLKDYRQLDASLAALSPLPVVQWEALAEKMSSAVASATMLTAAEAKLDVTIAGRIDGTLARTAWMRTGLAAGLLLTLCSGALLWRQHRTALVPVTSFDQTVASNVVTGPGIDPSAGPVMVQVNVGPAPLADHAAPVQTAGLNIAPKAVLAGDVRPVAESSPKIH